MENSNYSKLQMTALVGLRLLIGWHFLYEGVVKLLNPNWSSMGYLMGSQGFLKGLFHGIGTSPTMVGILDFVTIWAMIVIGVTLIFGFLLKPAAFLGIFQCHRTLLSETPSPPSIQIAQ